MGNVTHLEPPREQRDLRAAFQVELEQSGLSTARAADQIGRHASSITRSLNGTYTGDNEAVAADVERWLETRANVAKHSLDGAGLDRHTETSASRQITSALAYAHAAGDIVAIIGKPGRGKTWASERYCAGRTNAFYLSVSSAVFSLPGLLSLADSSAKVSLRIWLSVIRCRDDGEVEAMSGAGQLGFAEAFMSKSLAHNKVLIFSILPVFW